MKIVVASIMVKDQSHALAFYTEKLGFIKKHDIPLGGEHRWLTVVSPEAGEDVELLLEPMAFAPAATYQQQLYQAGIPATMFGVLDIQKEYERLVQLGVVFKSPPANMGAVTIAIFDDTCGNYIQIVEKP